MAEDLLAVILADDVFIEDNAGNRLSVAELRAFNESVLRGDSSVIPPLPEGPVQYTIGGETVQARLAISSDNLLSLARDAAAPIRVADPAQSSDEIRAMLALLASGRSDDLLVLLDDQIRIRQNDLIQLRRLLYVHQTALQNAVDIVQTKRIDFLEQKKDTWTDGVFGALFLAVIFTLFPAEALVGQTLFALSKVAMRPLGAKAAASLFGNTEFLLSREITEVGTNLKVLRGLANRSRNLRVTSRTKFSSAQEKAFKAIGATPSRNAESVSATSKQTQQLLEGLKAQRSANAEEGKRYRDLFIKNAARGVVLRSKIAPAVLGKALENTAFNNSVGIQQTAKGVSFSGPPLLPGSGTPLDIALKEQVQDIYATLLFVSEDALAALVDFRAACAILTPVAAELRALENILVIEAAERANAPVDAVDVFAADARQMILECTDAYEQLIWILMYGDRLVTDENTFNPAGPSGNLHEPRLVPENKLLVEYLKIRFYPESPELAIATGYDEIFKHVVALIKKEPSEGSAPESAPSADENAPQSALLDFSCFAKPDTIFDLLKGVGLQKVVLPDKPPSQ